MTHVHCCCDWTRGLREKLQKERRGGRRLRPGMNQSMREEGSSQASKLVAYRKGIRWDVLG